MGWRRGIQGGRSNSSHGNALAATRGEDPPKAYGDAEPAGDDLDADAVVTVDMAKTAAIIITYQLSVLHPDLRPLPGAVHDLTAARIWGIIPPWSPLA